MTDYPNAEAPQPSSSTGAPIAQSLSTGGDFPPATQAGHTLIDPPDEADRAADAWSHGAPIPVETMQRAIATQVCPWCHRGPFRILLAHLAKFGVDRYQARDMAEFPKTAKRLTDPDTSAALTVARRAKGRPAGLRNGGVKGERRSYSLGGRLEQGRKHTKDPDHFAEMARRSREAEVQRRIDVAIRFLASQGYIVQRPCAFPGCPPGEDWPHKPCDHRRPHEPRPACHEFTTSPITASRNTDK